MAGVGLVVRWVFVATASINTRIGLAFLRTIYVLKGLE